MLDFVNSIFPDTLWQENNYGSELPELILNFHETTSDDEFETLFREFCEIVHPMGSLIPLSKPAAQVLVELLKQTDNTHRRSSYCNLLAYFLRQTRTRIRYIPQFIVRFQKPQCVTNFRLRLEIYDVIAKEYDTYTHLLVTAHPHVQILSLEILSLLTESSEQSIPALLDCLSKTSDDWVKTVVIQVLSDLMRFKITRSERQEFAEKLENLIENDDSLQFRISVVLAYVGFYNFINETGDARPTVPQSIIDTLADLFSADIKSLFSTVENESIQYSLRRILPFQSTRVFSILRRYGYRTWILALEKSDISSTRLHEHYREMLESVFMRSDFNSTQHYWGNKHQYIALREAPDAIMYREIS